MNKRAIVFTLGVYLFLSIMFMQLGVMRQYTTSVQELMVQEVQHVDMHVLSQSLLHNSLRLMGVNQTLVVFDETQTQVSFVGALDVTSLPSLNSLIDAYSAHIVWENPAYYYVIEPYGIEINVSNEQIIIYGNTTQIKDMYFDIDIASFVEGIFEFDGHQGEWLNTLYLYVTRNEEIYTEFFEFNIQTEDDYYTFSFDEEILFLAQHGVITITGPFTLHNLTLVLDTQESFSLHTQQQVEIKKGKLVRTQRLS